MLDAPHPLTWEELCADPSLQDLPYRIELNGLNQIVLSPLYFRHGRYQGRIYALLMKLLPQGEPSVESAVMTSDNVKVPDVIWAPHAFISRHARSKTRRFDRRFHRAFLCELVVPCVHRVGREKSDPRQES